MASNTIDSPSVHLSYSIALPPTNISKPHNKLVPLPSHLSTPPGSQSSLSYPLHLSKDHTIQGAPASSRDTEAQWLSALALGVDQLREKVTAELAYWKDLIGGEEQGESRRGRLDGGVEAAPGQENDEDDDEEEEEEDDEREEGAP